MIQENVIIVLIIFLRTFIPFTILRFPLLGGILSLIADGIDFLLFGWFGYGFLSGIEYHKYDKVFDTWYLFFEFIVVSKWTDKLARNTGKFLFFWRVLGFLAFMIFGLRAIFFFSPNIFEYFFLTMLVIWKFNEKFRLNWKKLSIILLLVGIPNIVKEYIFHLQERSVWLLLWEKLFWWIK